MESASTADPTSRPAAQRLRDALVRLTADNTSEAPTASALCAIAGVSRNALYRYHPDILQELHKLQRQRHRDPGSARRALQQLRDEYKDLCQQVTNLASLVDHYFAASKRPAPCCSVGNASSPTCAKAPSRSWFRY